MPLRNRLYIILFFALFLSFASKGADREALPVKTDSIGLDIDSILDKIILLAPLHDKLIDDYTAEIYIKGKVHIRKKNLMMRYLPSMFRPKKGVRDYVLETYSDIHYTAPGIYDHKLKAISGTFGRIRKGDESMKDHFQVKIYSGTLLHSKLVSPLSDIAPKHYRYKVDSVLYAGGEKMYRISFTPRCNSYRLVSGYMLVSDDVWTVRKLKFSGRSEYSRYVSEIEMGKVGTDEEFVPVRFDINATLTFFGNVVDGNYTALLDYKSIKMAESLLGPVKKTRYKDRNYDLTESFTLEGDTATLNTDTAYFATLRPIPLTEGEECVYQSFYARRDTVMSGKKKKESAVFWGELGDMMVSNYTVDMAGIGSIRCSPLLNPFLISYSGTNGFSYRQEFKYNRLFTGDRLLRVTPKMGYNFTHKEFYWTVGGSFGYWPSKRASIHWNIGNGSRIYSSEVLDEIKAMPDSTFNLDKIHLESFHDFFMEFKHSHELINGLTLDVGILTHNRTAVNKSVFEPGTDGGSSEEGETPEPDLNDKFRNSYISFAPRVKLTWTPGQYYYMSGARKVNLHSRYPTFSVDWERGIKGVFGSTGKYERIEFDMQHKIALSPMSNLYYRAGGGAFVNQKQLYFIDFANFSRSDLPVGWNDDIGGVFQLLDRRWYNSSRKYMRANITYEAPFLIMPRLRTLTRFILNERLYFGILAMPNLNPYTEVGYGIGTHVFDFGVFVSNIDGKFKEVGFKFTFELFNKWSTNL